MKNTYLSLGMMKNFTPISGYNEESKILNLISSTCRYNFGGVIAFAMLLDHVVTEVIKYNLLNFKTEKEIYGYSKKVNESINYIDAIKLLSNSIRHFYEWKYINEPWSEKDGLSYSQGKKLCDALNIPLSLLSYKTKDEFFLKCAKELHLDDFEKLGKTINDWILRLETQSSKITEEEKSKMRHSRAQKNAFNKASKDSLKKIEKERLDKINQIVKNRIKKD